jgi:hypothetical protein
MIPSHSNTRDTSLEACRMARLSLASQIWHPGQASNKSARQASEDWQAADTGNQSRCTADTLALIVGSGLR